MLYDYIGKSLKKSYKNMKKGSRYMTILKNTSKSHIKTEAIKRFYMTMRIEQINWQEYMIMCSRKDKLTVKMVVC